MRHLLANPNIRIYALLALILIVLGLAGGADIFATRTVFSTLQQFAILGPVALALGMGMVLRHFDLSVAGMVGVAGCLSVLYGGVEPLLGLGLAVGFGGLFGAAQGLLVMKLRLGSIGVTLGGLLILNGLSYVITGNREIAYPRPDVTAFVDAALLGIVSPRLIIALVIFAIVGALMSYSRLGRDIIAAGSAPKAAMVAGVSVTAVTLIVFAFSGATAALAGGLLSFSLATASPLALADVLAPAAAAAIIGGVSLAGGRGHPLGIAGGVLLICTLRSGLTALNLPPYFNSITIGLVLLLVGLLDGADLWRRVLVWKSVLRRPTTSP